ncbi:MULTISPECIES: DUF3892 domain-containing protein [Cytobacillus]|uniref:DUF3892 domain-containing protein n=1 Tax=Cytobacillus TaxID=2675230 RepID=UPI00203EE294|nr:DUF3892 domain-containing protein [Cytobacillus firmus]MCM3705792.1 DUF3892 domain-containing protein [Cytobacillus firmus]URM34369.1 DUF3892 domain-containing protein [Cytobacillus firmus]
MNGEQLTAVYRNNRGEIISFQTSGGRIISYRKALMEAENGGIEGIHIYENEDGSMQLNPSDAPSFDDFPSLY